MPMPPRVEVGARFEKSIMAFTGGLVVAADRKIIFRLALAGAVEDEDGDAAREERRLVGVGLFLAGVEAAGHHHDGRTLDAARLAQDADRCLPSKGISTRSPGGERWGSASLRHATAFMCAARICGDVVHEQEFARNDSRRRRAAGVRPRSGTCRLPAPRGPCSSWSAARADQARAPVVPRGDGLRDVLEIGQRRRRWRRSAGPNGRSRT